MSDTPSEAGPDDSSGWETVAHHHFGGVAELDATIAAVLDGQRQDQPLYAAADVELAERFLTSANTTDASVVFHVADHDVRVLADGQIQLRRTATGSATRD